MTGLIIYDSNIWVYLTLCLLSFYILYNFKVNFQSENLIISLIRLTHKINLILLFFTFLFMLIFIIVDFTGENILNFFKDNVKAMLYYSFFSYFVFYGLKFIYVMKEFFKDNDLFAWAFFKDVMDKEMKEK